MIKQINNIKEFGIFKTFNWGSIRQFKTYNAIYGWNYSGKTTLSRIFRCFELGLLHDDYESGTFEVEDDEGRKYDQSNLNLLFDVRVFNYDFVKHNLRWEEDIDPILILGKESITLQKQLAENKQAFGEKAKNIDNVQRNITAQNTEIERGLSAKASMIKHALSIPNYDKTNLKPIVDNITSAPDKNRLANKPKEDCLTKYRRTDKKEQIPAITLSIPDVSNSYEQTQALLKRTATAKNIIERLIKEPAVENWVREGKGLHKDKTICQFCEKELDDDLIDKLNAHFSIEYENLLAEVRQLIEDLENNKVRLDLPIKAEYYSELRDEYEQAKALLESEVESFNGSIDELITGLNTKKTKLFEDVTIEKPQDNTEQLQVELDKTNEIIQKHNDITDNCKKDKNEAEEKLITHWASEFVIEEQYMETLGKITKNAFTITKLIEEQKTIQNRINEIEQQLSDTAKGAEAVNRHLRSYFGTDEIQIEVTKDDKFKLRRSGIKANNLSEGEKTAIAFAYFMTKLEDKNTTLANTIVFIDDPVSSLDSNHLFHTYSLIKNELADCNQIFISTHNYEFFNLIKDWFKDRKQKNSSFYLIEKLRNATATNCKLSELPQLLRKFRSEYAYLFSLLYKFDERPTPDYDYLYILPNLVRRYLEAYLGFKVPKSAGLEKKLSKLIEDHISHDKVLKFINQYSHNTSLPRSLNFSDFAECREVVGIVLKAVKNKDEEHFNVLVAETNDQ